MEQLLHHVSAVTEQKKCCESLAQKFDRFQTFDNQSQQHATTCNKGGVVGQLQAKFRTRAKISSELRHGPSFVQFIAPKGKEVWSNF